MSKNQQSFRYNFECIFWGICYSLKELSISSQYLIDSFPVSVCQNIRIPRCKLLQDKDYRGKNASKRAYFYGFKVQIITTKEGVPVEYFICAGEYADITAFKSMNTNLPPNSELYADSGYTDYQLEDDYNELEQINMLVARKSNAKRKANFKLWIIFKTIFSHHKLIFCQPISEKHNFVIHFSLKKERFTFLVRY